MKSIEQELQVAKQAIDELGKTFNIDSAKADIEKNRKSREDINASLNTLDDEISSLHKLSSLTAELELNKSAWQAEEKGLENLKQKHGNSIKALLNIQDLQNVKLKKTLEHVHQQLVSN